jgi:hypothetical protein
LRFGSLVRDRDIFPQDLIDAMPTCHALEIEEPHQPARDPPHLLEFLVSVLREEHSIVDGKIVLHNPAMGLMEA